MLRVRPGQGRTWPTEHPLAPWCTKRVDHIASDHRFLPGQVAVKDSFHFVTCRVRALDAPIDGRESRLLNPFGAAGTPAGRVLAALTGRGSLGEARRLRRGHRPGKSLTSRVRATVVRLTHRGASLCFDVSTHSWGG
jgi:hypothetical protein